MVESSAEIRLYESIKKAFFCSGFSPVFVFENGDEYTASICLLEAMKFHPGDKGMVELWFRDDSVSRLLEPGAKFTFKEGNEVIGEGNIIRVH